MSDISKIVRHRLQSGKPSGDHIDPNLLAALAERTLLQNEREFVLQHVSTCGDCREVLALSMPELVLTPVPLKSIARGWFRWPVLRWAAAGACVVVVGAAVSLRHQPPAAGPVPARYANIGALQPNAPAVATPVPVPQETLADKVEPQSSAKRAASPATPAKNIAQPAASNLTIATVGGAANQPSAPMSTAAPEPVAKSLDAQGSTDLKEQVNVESSNEMAEAELKKAPRDEVSEVISGKAKDADENRLRNQQNGNVGSMAYSLRLPASTLALHRADTGVVPRWKVTAEGALQRSLDSGQTWQSVPVASVTFRAVASVGAEVWAGGAAGALYHSPDSGRQWTQMKPATNGGSLTADIVTISFANPQNGQLTTANDEIWITANGGQTWTKQ